MPQSRFSRLVIPQSVESLREKEKKKVPLEENTRGSLSKIKKQPAGSPPNKKGRRDRKKRKFFRKNLFNGDAWARTRKQTKRVDKEKKKKEGQWGCGTGPVGGVDISTVIGRKKKMRERGTKVNPAGEKAHTDATRIL